MKKCTLGRTLGWLTVATVAAGAAYVVWKRSQPVEDPWAEEYWAPPRHPAPARPRRARAPACPGGGPTPSRRWTPLGGARHFQFSRPRKPAIIMTKPTYRLPLTSQSVWWCATK